MFVHPQEVVLSGIRFRVIRHGRSPRRFLAIHGDEGTAKDVVADHMRDHAGVAFIATGGTREVVIKNAKIDPNRLFSPAGAEISVRDLSPDIGPEQMVGVLEFLEEQREKLLRSLIPGKGSRLLSLHNNRDYSVQDELAASDETSIQEPNRPRDFFLCTNAKDYKILRQSPYNAVLQSKPYPDDGSLSRLAAKRGFRYVNLESAIGEYEAQLERLRWADEHLP